MAKVYYSVEEEYPIFYPDVSHTYNNGDTIDIPDDKLKEWRDLHAKYYAMQAYVRAAIREQAGRTYGWDGEA